MQRQRSAFASQKTHQGGETYFVTSPHPPLDLAAMFRAIGFWTDIREDENVDLMKKSIYNKNWEIGLIEDVTMTPNTFECFWEEGDDPVLHMHPSTYDVVHEVTAEVIKNFFSIYGHTIGYVFFNTYDKLPSIYNGLLRMAAQFRKTLADIECFKCDNDDPNLETFHCIHVCEKHDKDGPCVCVEGRRSIMPYNFDTRKRSAKRLKI
jgi:hypothetical protein